MIEIEELRVEKSRLEDQIKDLRRQCDRLGAKILRLSQEEWQRNQKPPSKRLGHVQHAVLEILPPNSEPVPVPYLNEQLSQFKPPSISRAISLLIEKGLVRRYSAPMRLFYGETAPGSACSVVCRVL